MIASGEYLSQDSGEPKPTVAPAALVTGGAQRIGAAICNSLHSHGYNIVIHYNRSANEAHQLATQLNQLRADSAVVAQAQLGSKDSAEHLAEQTLAAFGNCHLLINNASTFYPTPLAEINEQHWEDLLASNAKAPLFLAQSLANALRESRGSIINIADIHAQRPLANHTIYCMAKAANIMLTRSLALELAPTVRVNGIAPGAMLWPETDQTEDQRQRIMQKIPLAELGGCAPIVDAVLYLSNPRNYVTGQIIAVDGGKSLT